ncbi:preprotein translocase subunit YajC [Tabrizicola piscis]|jgi:hypothetical protein|uniref:Preprotein translocase subunit YajC n=1 Tax=Tabrizicola piscis TaxID=2494374 RepID=A0A3S8U2R7_9RHOB|nr:preprotein translocase subunit YajC [Tabrizicola piscis]AZL57858.1 preprotein translocase subunit YajC [Tabrizicola piscis]
MPEATIQKRESIERSIAGYLAAGGVNEHSMRLTLAAAHDEGFAVGDEVICAHGGPTGVIISIAGHDAVISWACRGKSTEHLTDLSHIEHET